MSASTPVQVTAFVDFDSTTTTHQTVALRAGPSAFTDFDAGIPQGLTVDEFGSLIGPDHEAAPDEAVIVNCATSDAGRLVIEVSTDGIEWSSRATFLLLSCASVGLKFTSSAGHYRLRFDAPAGASVKRVLCTSRPA